MKKTLILISLISVLGFSSSVWASEDNKPGGEVDCRKIVENFKPPVDENDTGSNANTGEDSTPVVNANE